MTSGVTRARRPIDGHVAEQFEIMGDDRSLSAGHPAFGNANDESIRVLPAKIGTFRLEKWMPLVSGLCRLPRIFARRSPFGVASPGDVHVEMLEVGLGSEPEVGWGCGGKLENP